MLGISYSNYFVFCHRDVFCVFLFRHGLDCRNEKLLFNVRTSSLAKTNRAWLVDKDSDPMPREHQHSARHLIIGMVSWGRDCLTCFISSF